MKYLIPVFLLTLLAACPQPVIDGNDPNNVEQTTAPKTDAFGTGSIADDPDRIVLSDYSQDQQKRDREAYAQRLQEIASQRLEVSNVLVPEGATVNVATFARSSNHAVGTRVYDRSGSKRGSCSFRSPDAAQRTFLEAGGPERDPKGYDPDGDGFACNFDPTIYRQLR